MYNTHTHWHRLPGSHNVLTSTLSHDGWQVAQRKCLLIVHVLLQKLSITKEQTSGVLHSQPQKWIQISFFFSPHINPNARSKLVAEPRTESCPPDQCPVVLGTGHHSFPSHTSRGWGKAVLQLSELRFSINWDPPASCLMINSCGIACACSFCAQTLPISTPIQRNSSDKLKPYVSCLLSAYIHSDRVHGSDAPVAVHEAGEAQPSGSLLSGASGEQQREHPAHIAVCMPHHVTSWHHQQHQEKGKESRGLTVRKKKRYLAIPYPSLPWKLAQGGGKVFGKKKKKTKQEKNTSAKSLQPTKSHQTSATTQLSTKSC